jgi:hypothetical protein
MEYLNRIRQIACRIDLDRFVIAHSGCYLLGTFPRPDVGDEPEWSFTTQPGVKASDLAGDSASEQDRRLMVGRFLVKLEKSTRNPWKYRISVGRAKNNDIVIRHPSVSKLHAHFLISHDTPRGEAPVNLRLTDVGSSNGTQINGQELAPDEIRELNPGDLINFGEIAAEFLDAGTLHGKLRMLFPNR